MTNVIFEEGKFIFVDRGEKKMLLDVSDLMSNKSRYPMQILPDGKTGIPGLFVDLVNEHSKLSDGEENFFPFYLMDILTVSYLIRTSAPLRILELGATSGILSYHLASLIGKLNSGSLLCCVTNVIGNGSENHWLDRISMVEHPPGLSLLVSDYDDTPLETGYFDIVVLNGAECYDRPYETVREAKRLVKKNGVLLCYIKNEPFLESCFKLVFPEREEYGISPQETILVVTNPKTAWEQPKPPVLEEEVSRLVESLRQTIKTECSPEEIRPLIHRIDECIDLAIKNFDIGRKVELLRLKGIVLDYMLNIGKEFEEEYRNIFLAYEI